MVRGNSRFATTMHKIAVMTVGETKSLGGTVTSDEATANFGVCPVHLRKVLVTLRTAGVVAFRPGSGGG